MNYFRVSKKSYWLSAETLVDRLLKRMGASIIDVTPGLTRKSANDGTYVPTIEFAKIYKVQHGEI